jgi:hypothetical protein
MQEAQPQERLQQVNIHELMEKVSSKKDVYNFLTQECEAYLPKMDTINTYFLKQVTRGAKDVSHAVTDPVVHQEVGREDIGRASD